MRHSGGKGRREKGKEGKREDGKRDIYRERENIFHIGRLSYQAEWSTHYHFTHLSLSHPPCFGKL